MRHDGDDGSGREGMIRQMVEENRTALLRMCYLYLHDVQLAEDAVQETFIKAIRALDGFRGEASMRTWLIRIAIRTCVDMQRSPWQRWVNRRVTPEMLPEQPVDADPADSALTLAVMNLPRREREAVILYYYQGLTMQEAADALGITQPTVSYRLRRARWRLRRELEGREEE